MGSKRLSNKLSKREKQLKTNWRLCNPNPSNKYSKQLIKRLFFSQNNQ